MDDIQSMDGNLFISAEHDGRGTPEYLFAPVPSVEGVLELEHQAYTIVEDLDILSEEGEFSDGCE